jgi:hypothetical protein
MTEYHGCIDKCTSEYIDGWFFCSENDSIDIYADGVLIDTIKADITRDDINKALNSNVVSGFKYYYSTVNTPTVIEVKFHNTETHIENSPIYVEKHQLRYIDTNIKNKCTNNKKTILFLLSTYDGGTVYTTNDLIEGISNEYNCLILHAFKQELRLLYKEKCLGSYYLTEQVLPETHTSNEYDIVFKNILIDYNISIIHIRHICWHSLTCVKYSRQLKIPVVFSFHDYYTVCPSHNLLDEKTIFCNGVCTKGCSGSKCSQVLWFDNQISPLKHEFIFEWRKIFSTFLKSCNAYITTHKSVSDIICQHYQFLQDKIQIIEHGRNFKVLNFKKNNKKLKSKIIIIVPGALTVAKGLNEIKKLKELDTANILDIHYFSKIDYNIGIRHDFYKRDNLHEVVANVQPEVALILSIWNETYCHTLTEMWAYGIPTICYCYKTVEDRTNNNKNGIICNNTLDVYRALIKRAYRNIQIKNFQNNLKKMCSHYIDIYNSLYIK